MLRDFSPFRILLLEFIVCPSKAINNKRSGLRFEIGFSGMSILAASKAATRSLVRTLGAELAPRGVRVNAVSPGAIATPFYSKIGLPDATLSAVAASITEKVGLKRFGEAVELAKTVLFLASDDSSYTTGTELVVDGGLTQF